MKLAALALLVLAGCSDGRVRYTVRFAPGVDEAALRKVVEGYKERLEKSARDARIAVDAKAATISVELPSPDDDRVSLLLGAQGEFEFLAAFEGDSAGERERLDAWRTAHPDASLREFDTVARDQGGPPAGCIWRAHHGDGRLVPLVRSTDARSRFTTSDIARADLNADDQGKPMAAFELKKERQADFGAWTEGLSRKSLAIVLDDQILTIATVNGRLPGRGVVMGAFSSGESQAFVRLMGMSPLPLAPRSVTSEFLR